MSYEPTIWKKGDKVTSTKLNKIENGIQGNDEEITSIKEDFSELTAESGTKDIAVGEIITNSYVDTDGTIKAYNGWNRTDYIDISRYESITANIATTYAAYYGASKEFVGQANITANTEMPVPANAKYIMISQASLIMSNLMLKGSCSDGIVTKIQKDLDNMRTATAGDVGKALKAKKVTNGKVTEWEFGEAGETIELDATLTDANKAAQAKAVGDAIGNISSVLDAINGEVI